MKRPMPVETIRNLLGLLKLPSFTRQSERRPPGPKPPELMTESDWIRHRAPVRHRDESLSPAAGSWALDLPAEIRPVRLCVQFPRIANRLALLWMDPGLTDHCLDELMFSRRPGRQGFPADIQAEIEALHAANELRLYGSDEGDDE